MTTKVRIAIACGLAALALMIWGCGKDEGTNPEDLPSVTVTLGSNELSFPAVGAQYDSTEWILIAFDQGQLGMFPMASIYVIEADSIHIGVPVACNISVYLDGATQFVCGGLAQNDTAVANVFFSKLELRQDGRISGDVTGSAEHRNHPSEELLPLSIQFMNIPVQKYPGEFKSVPVENSDSLLGEWSER